MVAKIDGLVGFIDVGKLWVRQVPGVAWKGEGEMDVKAHMRYVHYAVRTSCTRCETTFKELKNHMRHLLQVGWVH